MIRYVTELDYSYKNALHNSCFLFSNWKYFDLDDLKFYFGSSSRLQNLQN